MFLYLFTLCLFILGKGQSEAECVYSAALDLATSSRMEDEKKTFKIHLQNFPLGLFVCLFAFCLSYWELADLDLAVAPAAEGNCWKDQP